MADTWRAADPGLPRAGGFTQILPWIGLVKAVLAEDPLSGNIFVFINRRGTLIKTIYWDRTGFCLFAKRLERGRFHLPGEGRCQELDAQRLQLVLDGIELGRRHRG